MLKLDDCGGAGHGHLPAEAGDCFPVRPANPRKWDLPVPESFRKTLFAKTVTIFANTETLFAKTATHSAGTVTQSSLY